MRAISTPAAAAASESEEGREMLAGDERASDWNPKLTNDDQIEFHRRKQPEEGNRDFEPARSLARSTNGRQDRSICNNSNAGDK